MLMSIFLVPTLYAWMARPGDPMSAASSLWIGKQFSDGSRFNSDEL